MILWCPHNADREALNEAGTAMATKSTVGENLKSNMGSCSILKFIKIRVVDFLSSQPSSFCFILSLFFIAVTLALLGLYIKGDHMPDIDAMKVAGKLNFYVMSRLSLWTNMPTHVQFIIGKICLFWSHSPHRKQFCSNLRRL